MTVHGGALLKSWNELNASSSLLIITTNQRVFSLLPNLISMREKKANDISSFFTLTKLSFLAKRTWVSTHMLCTSEVWRLEGKVSVIFVWLFRDHSGYTLSPTQRPLIWNQNSAVISEEAEKLYIVFPLRKCLLVSILTGDNLPSNWQMKALVICCCDWSSQQTPEPVVFNGVFKSRHLGLYVILAVTRG